MATKYQDIYQRSIQKPEVFWSEIANDIFWYKKPTKILNSDNPPFYKWFQDGITNPCYNAVDLHVEKGKGENTAMAKLVSLTLSAAIDLIVDNKIHSGVQAAPSNKKNIDYFFEILKEHSIQIKY